MGHIFQPPQSYVHKHPMVSSPIFFITTLIIIGLVGLMGSIFLSMLVIVYSGRWYR